MSETSKVVIAQRYSQGFTYDGYIDQLGGTKERFSEHMVAFHLASADAQFFKDIVRLIGGLRVLAIAV